MGAIAQMINSGKPWFQPSIVATYDALYGPNYTPTPAILNYLNYFPSSYMQIGLWMPSSAHGLANVSNGKWDRAIHAMARYYKMSKQRIFLRIGYEFDFPRNGYGSTDYIKAFRHIHDIFTDDGVTNVAYVWDSYSASDYNMYNWYPGNNYVDWFAFNVFTSTFNWSWYLSQARAHNKPVMIGEASSGLSNGTSDVGTWLFGRGGFFDKLKSANSPTIKGYQYINSDWSKDPDWNNGTSSGVYTGVSSWVNSYNNEMQNPVYIQRNGGYHNQLALWADACTYCKPSDNETSYNRALDQASALIGYDYTVLNAVHHYGSPSKATASYWHQAWGNSFEIDLSVPQNSRGIVNLGAYDTDAPFDIFCGSRRVFGGIEPVQIGSQWNPIKFMYQPSDIVKGKVAIKLQAAGSGALQVQHIGIQSIYSMAPPAPGSVKVTSNPPRISFTAPINGPDRYNIYRYNIYRDGVLIGATTDLSYTDIDLQSGKTSAVYNVSAYNKNNAEGPISASVQWNGGTPSQVRWRRLLKILFR